MADRPIYAESADGMLHEFPSGTDPGVIDSAMKQYASSVAPSPAPAPAPEPAAPSAGTLKAMGKAAGQETIQSAGETVTGVGAVTKMVGGTEAREEGTALDLYNKLDQGEDFRSLMKAAPTDVDRLALRAYQIATPEQRQQIKQAAMNVVAAPDNQVQLTGEHMMKAGEALGEKGKQVFPLTPEEEQRPTVIATKMVAGLTKYIGAAVAGGMPAVVGVAGVDAFGKTYNDARTAGRTDDEAMGDALINGMVQGGLMTVPIGQATKVFDAIPVALKGDFIKALAEAGKSGLTLTAFSQVSTIADNVIAKGTYDPTRKPLEGVGEHLPETFVAGAVLPLAAHGISRLARTPEQTAKPVLDAPTVDDAIARAREVVDQPAIEDIGAQAREYGNEGDQQEASVLKLFGGLNQGTVERAQDGTYHYNDGEQSFPLKPWDGAQREDTIPTALADAQRDHYGRMGVRVIYLENDRAIPFDGAVDPAQPDTIFLSNNPDRNAAQVGAHELTHVLESTRLPDGTNLGDLLQQQVAAGITPEGRAYAERLFGPDAPKRQAFPEGQEGDSLHADAVTRHLVRELGADIGGEAPRFQTFLPRVVDAVQQRYGSTVAADVVRKLVEGIQQAMRTLRQFFFHPAEGAEYGQPPTVSQHWVTNLEAIHDTLAKMYAERFGAEAGLDRNRPNPAEQRLLPAPALVTPPPRPAVTPENVFQPETYGRRLADLTPEPARVDRPHAQRMGVAGERERLEGTANAEGGMGRRDMTLDRNQKMSEAWARWNVMHEEVGDTNIRHIVDDSGASPDHVDEISRYYNRKEGETPRKAFEDAVSRWVDRAEANAIREFNLVDTELEAPRGEKSASQPTAENRVEAARPGEPGGGQGGREAGGGREPDRGVEQQAAAEPARVEPPPAAPAEEPTQLQREQAAVREMRERSKAKPEEATPEPAAPERPAGPKVIVNRSSGHEEIGKNHIGQTLYEDGRGVRSIIENGVRRTEPVGIRPGSREVTTDRTKRPEYQLAEPHPTRPDLKAEYESPVLPPAPEAHPEPKPESPHAREVAPEHKLAERVADALDEKRAEGIGPFSSRDLQKWAEWDFGGTLAQGKYSRDRLYDAIELGVNRFIQRHPERFSTVANVGEAMQTAKELARIKEALPTQTVRAGEKDAYQQFSTPPDYAYAANWIAHLRPEDHVLEPSAGVGGLIVHAMTSGVRETTVNELSDKRRGMIAALEPTRITAEDAAQLHNILPDEVRPTVVVMNPPFTRAVERMGGKMVLDEGAKHIEQALARLEPGGRLVAIVGDSMKPEGTEKIGTGRGGTGRAFKDWWARIGEEYNVLANVGVDREIYTKYGTSFPTRLLVIDKNPPSGRPLVTGQVHDAADLIEHLKEVRDERSALQQNAGEPGRAALAEGRPDVAGRERELPRAAGELGAGEGRARTAADLGEPAGAARRRADSERAPGLGLEGGGPRNRVVPEQPEPVAGRAGAKPGEPARAGAGPDLGVADRGGDGLRPDGSGQRDEPGVTPAPEDVVATEAAVTSPAPASEGVSEAIYENYRPQRITVAGAKPHPGALVQSAAMASVLPPKTDYKPRIPAALVKGGALSDAQLEAIVYAGHAHSDVMPDGKRRGFFIGDGTGVGKGREIAGILLDNKQNGRTKHVWVSEKGALLNDAKRDWNGLGQPASEIIPHSKIKAGDDITAKNGILFTTYDTLKSAEQTKTNGEKVRGQERVDQIIKWLGKDFDGVIAFDESHNLGNSVDTKGGRGVKKAAAKALAGVRLQNELPNARVVYVSATGATEVGNLAYADRLGLWGEGTPFPNRNDFVGKVSEGGMAAMELVARDMKALGHYIARSLSYDGVDYDRVEHVLSKDQRVVYDKLAEGWQTVLQNFEKAMEATGVTKDGKTLNGKQKSAMLSAFWGGHQRFFNQIITSMQMPSVLKGVEADLKAKRQAVLQLVNTMEAAQERALDKAKRSGEGDLEDLDLTPRDQLMQLVEKSFPVQQMERYIDENGNERSRGVMDSKGNAVLNKQAVAMRERLLDELGSIRVPDGPLEMILNHFGKDKVAEVTGRSRRVVRDESGKTVLENRGAQSNVADANDFQAGKKQILIFSEAGGTGRSYHAAIGSGAEDARRSHYLVQGGWRADKAVQGFGRTHRTSQASAPIFHLVTTDLQGQKRFISSIARRLGQLGALTKGERRTGDQGMFGMRDNLESEEARTGLRQFFHDVAGGKVEGVSMDDLERGMGLKMRDPETGGLASPLPEMSQFLNRVLSLKIDHQNRVFDAFSERMDQAIDRAAAAGTLDTGVETYKADKITKQSEQTVFTDPRSGAETQHVHLQAHTRNHPVDFDATLAGKNKTNGRQPEGFVQNNRSGRVFAVTSAGDRTDADGRVTSQVRLTSPVDYQMVDRDKVGRDNFTKLSEQPARSLWDKQVAETPEFRKSDLHLITGAVLPIWDRLGGNPKIYRLQTDQGERMLGRVIPSSLVDETLKRLGAEGLKVDAKPAEIAKRVLEGDQATLANDWTIKRSRVSGEDRLELVGPDFQHRAELERNGLFSERIAYQSRWFIPTDPAAAAKAIEAITKTRPVTSLSEAGGAKFSPRINREYTPEQREALKRVFAGDPATLREKIDNARDDIGRKLVRETLDAYIGIKGNDPEGYMAARLANSVAGAQEVFRLYGTLKFNGSTYDYKDLNGGVRGLVKALGPEAGDFLKWVAGHRAERLKAEDRENLMSGSDIEALKSLNRGEVENDYRMPNGTVTRRREAVYADALRRLDAFNKNALDLGVESGLLKRDDVDALWSNPFYVPFYREAEASGSKAFVGGRPSSALIRQNAFKALKGGTEKLNNDLWENALGNWDHMIDAALRNKAASQILDTASRPDLAAAEKVTTQDFNHRMTKAEKAETVWAMEDGEKQYYRVTDPMVFKAVSALEAASTPGPIMNVARWFSRALRYGVTANPLFAVRNLIRDTENTIAVSQVSTNPLKNLVDGFGQIDVGDRLKNLARAMAGQETETAGLEPEAVSAMAGGALMRMGSASDAGISKSTILDTPGKLRALGRYFGEVAGAYKETLASGEDVNRLALYKQLREQGAPHDFAAFSARDLQDFTLRGASPFVRTITDITPFLGARLQGLYKLGRAASDADKSVTTAVASKVARSVAIRAATVMGAMTLAGLALDAIYHDDEDYKKRTEYDRQTYYWFKVGDAQFRVPKGFELAALSSLATDGIEAFFDKEMTGQRWINNFWTALSTNLQVQAPAAVQPMIDLATNTRGVGGPIESTSMQRLEPQERYTADSTLVARGMSAAMNAALRVAAPRADGPSPVQIDYLTNGYGGWLATAVLGMADTVARSLSSEPERPEGDFWAKATQGLVRTEPTSQSRYVDMLYEQGKQIEEAHATFLNLAKLGRGEEARAFAQDRKEELSKYPTFERVKRLEGEINQQMRVITNDTKLSAEQKKIKIMQLNAMKNRAAEGLFATP